MFGFALLRVFRRPERLLLAALGVAAGAGLLAATMAASTVAGDRSLARAVARTPAQERAIRAVWPGVPDPGTQEYPKLDRLIRPALASVLGREPFGAVVYRETEIGGALVDLGAIDGLRNWVELRSGRLPSTCSRDRCEVLEVGGAGRIPPRVGRLRLVRVGTGSLVSALPLGTSLGQKSTSALISSASKYHEPSQPPILLAEGVAGLADAAGPALATDSRAYIWNVPLRAGDLHPWSWDGFRRRFDDASTRLSLGTEFVTLEGPVDELQAAVDSSRLSAKRLLLLGGSVGALLLTFLVLAGTAMRRDAETSRRQLTWRGARRRQLASVSLAETLVVSTAGAAVGWAAGTGAAALIAERLGSQPGAAVLHSALSPLGIGLAAAVAGTGAVVLALALWAPSLRIGTASVTLADVAAIGALIAIVLAAARGSLNAESLTAQRGTGGFLLLLPALISLVIAIGCARLLAPALRLLEHAGRRGPAAVRLAALSLARNPGRAMVAIVFVVISLGLALFAAAYRSTLIRGQHDEAAYEVPRSFVVGEDYTKLVSVLEAAPLPRWRRLASATPVVRLPGDVPGAIGPGTDLTVLAVPAADLTQIDGWRSDFSATGRARLAQLLAPARRLELRGVRLPADARTLSLPVSIRGDGLRLSASVETTRGDFAEIRLGRVRGGSSRVLRGVVPAGARGGLLLSLTFDIAVGAPRGSANGGLDQQPYATGTMTLGELRVNGRSAGLDYRSWRGVNGLVPRSARTGTTVRFLVTPESTSRLRARQPTDGSALPAIVSPGLARLAHRGLLSVDVVGEPVRLRVVGVARHFPTLDGEFVVADQPTASVTLAALHPGVGVVDELWLEPHAGTTTAELRRALARPPYSDLAVTSHSAVAHDLESDPLARASLLALGASAIVALAIAIVGLLLALVADLRDERAELFDLEAQGAGPGTLRRHVRLRMLMLTGYGLLGGLAAGAVLSALVTDLIVLTVNGAAPQPPLVLAPDWPLVLAAAVAYAAAGALAVALVARRGLASLAPSARYAEMGA